MRKSLSDDIRCEGRPLVKVILITVEWVTRSKAFLKVYESKDCKSFLIFEGLVDEIKEIRETVDGG